MISIVIPVYNEAENVVLLHQKIREAMDKIGEKYETIFIDDGSTDATVEKLRTLTGIKILILSMDFGQTSALDAGIHEAEGEIIITMDGDLQNDPADIPRLISKIREGYDVVSGWRQERNDSWERRILSRLANWLTAKMTGLYLHDSACALKAYRNEVITPIHLYGEMHVFLPAFLYSRGAKVAEIPVIHHARKFGVSKHYFMKAVKDIFDLLTIKFLASLRGRPLIFFGGLGLGSFFLGVLTAAVAIYLKLEALRNFGQTPLPILSIFFVLSGILFFMLGFLAELILRVYFETNKKTPYIIREKIEIK
ncbi:MAG: Dolichol-phosphate mannosyltransferase [Candidatus Peregrinibacteria bacterium GW2011_GWC2_39_14]|nr:MAG: Dolichol-phosphate mannosyltransferase [Candidatus Peregrinibacteria bacterium GW2011_GWC2_39_14]